MSTQQTFDVVVVGSGAGGMLAAIRAHDLGLKSVVIEKTDRYGGTSAVSGGAIWIPNNGQTVTKDSAAAALRYLRATTQGKVPEAKLARFVDTAPQILPYLSSLGVHYYTHPTMSYPDYYPQLPDAVSSGRTMFVKPMDGAALGEEFFRMREAYPELKLLQRIALDVPEAAQIGHKAKGWKRLLIRLLAGYWGDVRWRRRTQRDRRLAIGNALIGGLRKAMAERGIPLQLKTRLRRITTEQGRITGIVAEQDGRELHISASRGVVLAAGGFEQSQELRDRYLDQPTSARWSATPRDNNVGEALQAALDVGADAEFLNEAWWTPTVPTPSTHSPNAVRGIALFFERGYPHSMAVNRLGKRFTNEICSYHQFGEAMLRDNAATGANLPCWLVFDATFRSKYPLGPLLPGHVVPDRKLPTEWLDNLLYRAESLDALAGKIGVPADALKASVQRFNGFARNGVDEDFGRGSTFYENYFGDPTHSPSRVLGEIVTAPFYAVRVDLGDLGTKGGPKTDEHARVLCKEGRPMPGLYAVGNVAGSVMGGSYPGAGATLASAMTFAYLAAADLARQRS